jgi:hypothetical protein
MLADANPRIKVFVPKEFSVPQTKSRPSVILFTRWVVLIVLTLIQIVQFRLHKLPNGHYHIIAHGAHTGVERDRVYAFLLPHPPPEEWVITRVWNGEYMLVPLDFQSTRSNNSL